jgi:hypothetical protein
VRRKFAQTVKDVSSVQEATTYEDGAVKKQNPQFKSFLFSYDETVQCLHTAGAATRRPRPVLGVLLPEDGDHSFILEKIVAANLEEVKELVKRVEENTILVRNFPEGCEVPASLQRPETFSTIDHEDFTNAFITTVGSTKRKLDNDGIHSINKDSIKNHSKASSDMVSPTARIVAKSSIKNHSPSSSTS